MISRMKVFRSRFAVDSAARAPFRYLLPLALAVCALLPRLLLYPYLDERSAFVLFTQLRAPRTRRTVELSSQTHIRFDKNAVSGT